MTCTYAALAASVLLSEALLLWCVPVPLFVLLNALLLFGVYRLVLDVLLFPGCFWIWKAYVHQQYGSGIARRALVPIEHALRNPHSGMAPQQLQMTLERLGEAMTQQQKALLALYRRLESESERKDTLLQIQVRLDSA